MYGDAEGRRERTRIGMVRVQDDLH